MKRGLYQVALLTLLANPATAVGADTLWVDLTRPLGPARRVAAGLHGGLWDVVPDSLWRPLRLTTVALPAPVQEGQQSDPTYCPRPQVKLWERAASDSIRVVLVLDNTNRGTRIRPWISREWEPWQAYLDSVIAFATEARDRYGVVLEYALWTEPDRGPLPVALDPDRCRGSPAWTGSPEEFLWAWAVTVRYVRRHDPAAVIAGPKLTHYDTNYGRYHEFDADVPCPLDPDSVLTMFDFLEFSVRRGCLPDVVSWHEFDRFWIDGQGNDNNMVVAIESIQDTLRALGVEPSAFSYSVGEMMMPYQYRDPGDMVRHFALAERAALLGLRYACRAYHCRQSCLAAEEGVLSGLLDYRVTDDGAIDPGSLRKRFSWWAQAAYADLGDTLASVRETSRIDAVAGWDADRCVILLGNHSGEANGPLGIRIVGLGDEDEDWRAQVRWLPRGGTGCAADDDAPQSLDGLWSRSLGVDMDSTGGWVQLGDQDAPRPGEALWLILTRHPAEPD